jgi:hypothetical protein
MVTHHEQVRAPVLAGFGHRIPVRGSFGSKTLPDPENVLSDRFELLERLCGSDGSGGWNGSLSMDESRSAQERQEMGKCPSGSKAF